MSKVIVVSALLILKINMCECSGIFHEGSKITFLPDLESAYFGYSVVLSDIGLIVGAPKAASSENKTISPGLVYNCSLKELSVRNSTCRPISVDKDEFQGFFAKVMNPSDFFKDDMWYGATIAVVPGGKLLVCAPRWATLYMNKHLLANGACYLIMQTREMALIPLKEMTRQAFLSDGTRREYGLYGTHLNFYAYAQVGMSMKVTERNTIIIGAPGLLQWTGGIVDYQFRPDPRSKFFSKQPTTNLYYTKELGPDDYFGYSVESGIFGIDKKVLYVAGAPRSNSGHGQVLIFEPAFRETDPLNVLAKIRGPQLGSYFGASLCSLDVNGDGRTDLLVGAPNFVKKEGELHYDQGAVFVYLNQWQGQNFTFSLSSYVSGLDLNGARFGTVIADMGDLNGDGFRDVAIGAPWENQGRGAVYVYRGGEKGLSDYFIQRIVAENTETFGISISKGFDVDNNNCSDLAVGAINSGAVYLYRCVPSMDLHVSIKVPDAMYLPLNATNFTALFCIEAAEKLMWPNVKLPLQAKISVDTDGDRAWISKGSEYHVTVKPGSVSCEERVVQVTPVADLSKPINIQFELKPAGTLKENSTIFLKDEARLSEKSKLHTSFDIQLNRDCGEDLICKPLLEMSFEALDSPYVPGSENRLGIKLLVLNKDEPAYGAKVHLVLPSSPKRLPSACSLEEFNVTCDIPAPLHRNESIEWEIELEFTEKISNANEIKIVGRLDDPLHSENATDEVVRESIIAIKPEANFNISGTALPNRTVAVTRDELNDATVVAFVHYFEVTNFGPSNWLNLTARISLAEKVYLGNVIAGCSGTTTLVECFWPIPAQTTVTLSLPLRFNLKTHGDYLQVNVSYNATSTIILLWDNQNKTSTVITTLLLDPAPPLWPLIVGIFAGLLVLAAIVYGLYKYGFFKRKQRDDMKRLQEEEEDANSLTDLSLGNTHERAQELEPSEDSD